jgi:Holliday junction resolvase RusA-like endonuclease
MSDLPNRTRKGQEEASVIILPYPPFLNRYYRKWRNRIVISDEGRAYKVSAMVQARAQGMKQLQGQVSLRLRFFRRIRRGDIDGPLKCLFDSLQGIAYENDSQVRRLEAELFEDKANPRVEVELEALRV